jgi:type II secretory pathway component GspD/PulD (secretin)
LLAQYTGTSSVSVPQIQYEDLGLTLKTTPQIMHSREVTLKLDLKIEALGSGSINSLPILNNRQLTSTITIPAGQTALLASEISHDELRSVNGLPFLSELPGFQGTEKSTQTDRTELLITLTPHIVRNKSFQITSRRLLLAHNGKYQE